MIESAKIVPALLVVLSNAALFVAAELWKRSGRAKPEWTRKLVHIGAGLLALPLPWIFETHVPILVMGSLFTLALLMTKRGGLLRSVHGVDRRSLGELIYPSAIYLTFLLTGDVEHRHLYPIPILALALADALSGLVGMRHGRHIFRVLGEKRSLEGSLAFFLCCTTTTLALLLVSTGLAPPAALGIACVVGLTGGAVEAVSIHGTDNITVPVVISLVVLQLVPASMVSV